MGSYAGDDDDEPDSIEQPTPPIQADVEISLKSAEVDKKKKGTSYMNVSPHFHESTSTIDYRHSVSCHYYKVLSLREVFDFFHNIMRQYSFSKSTPIIASVSEALLLTVYECYTFLLKSLN